MTRNFSPPRTHEDDVEFVQIVQEHYQTVLARTRNPAKASRAANDLRSAVIVSRAKAAAAKLQR